MSVDDTNDLIVSFVFFFLFFFFLDQLFYANLMGLLATTEEGMLL